MVSEQDRLALSDEMTFQDLPRVHRIFAELRNTEPVAWCPEPWGGAGFWSITTYDDIQSVSRNPKVFSSDGRHGGITLPTPEMVRNRYGLGPERDAEQSIFDGGRSMISMDPPEHNQHRRMIAPGFTPQRLDAMVDGIRRRCVAILDRVALGHECEFVSAVAAELPIQMLAELFDVPQDDRHKLFEWSNIIIGGDDPDIATSREHVMKAIMEMIGYAMQLYQQRLASPGSDLISMLVHAQADGKQMEMPDYLSAFVLLVVAGNETTRNSISGGIQALSMFPEQRRKLIENPGLIPQAVDEIIRWVHPVIYMRRTCLEDTVVGGQMIRAGDKLALWYVSGNRDESKWSDPFRFDVAREGPRHLSFGYGQHLCIGWRLAEIQLTVALEEMLKRFPDYSVAGTPARMRSNFLSSIKQMRVLLRAA